MARVEQSYDAHTKRIDASGVLTSAEIPYIVFEAADEDDALRAVLDVAPKSLGKAPLSSIEIDSRENDATYKVNALYEEDESISGGGSSIGGGDDSGEPQMSFDCSGGTAHIVRSFNQQKWKTEPNPNGMIGWNGKPGQEAEYAGVDVVTATMRESYTLQMRPSQLTTSYKRMLANLTGKVNSKSFKGWEAGEVLFLGASFSGNQSGSDRITVTFNFAIQQNESAVPISPELAIKKRGWEYVWTITKTVDDPETKTTKVELVNAYVEQVYPYADFGKLKL